MYLFVYSYVPLQLGLIYHDVACDTVITVVESKTDIRIIKHTPYFALVGEL